MKLERWGFDSHKEVDQSVIRVGEVAIYSPTQVPNKSRTNEENQRPRINRVSKYETLIHSFYQKPSLLLSAILSTVIVFTSSVREQKIGTDWQWAVGEEEEEGGGEGEREQCPNNGKVTDISRWMVLGDTIDQTSKSAANWSITVSVSILDTPQSEEMSRLYSHFPFSRIVNN